MSTSEFTKEEKDYLDGLIRHLMMQETIGIGSVNSMANVATYNPPFFWTDKKENIMKNLDAHNKSRTSTDTPTKASVEAMVGDIGGSDFLKAVPVGKSSALAKKAGRNVLKESVLLEADPEPTQAQTNQPQGTQTPVANIQAQPTTSQETANNAQSSQSQVPTDNAQPSQSQETTDNAQPAQPTSVDNATTPQSQTDNLAFLKEFEQKDLILIYNQIFVPYFSLWRNKFDVKQTDKCLPILMLYAHCDARLSKIRNEDFEPKHLYLYQRLREANASIIPAVHSALTTMNISPVQSPQTSEQIRQLMLTNMSAILRSLHRVLLPVSNGYIQTLASVDNPVIKELSEAADTSQVIQNSVEKITGDQKQFLLSRLSGVAKGLSGTYLVARLQGAVNAMDFQFNINEKGKVEQAVNLVADNPSAKSLAEQYKKSYNDILAQMKNYDKDFNTFIGSLTPQKFVVNNQINKAQIAKYLRDQSKALLNQVNDADIEDIAEKIKGFIKTTNVQQQQQKQKDDSEAQRKANSSIRNYLLNTLGMKNDSLIENELDLIESESKNLNGFNSDNNGIQFSGIGSSTSPQQIHDTLLGSIKEKGNIKEMLQDWFKIARKNEMILYVSNNIDFEQMMRSATQDSFDESFNQEDKTGKPPSLLAAIGETTLQGIVQGQRVFWQAGQATGQVIKELNAYGFLKDLLELSEDFWSEYIFDDDFKKSLFSDGAINNPDDIKSAQQALGANGFQDKKDFASLIRHYIGQVNIKDGMLVKQGVTRFTDLLQKYSNHQIPPELITSVGKVLVSMMSNFMSKHSDDFYNGHHIEGISENTAKFFATNILNALRGSRDSEQSFINNPEISSLQNELTDLFNTYGTRNNQDGSDNQKPQTNIQQTIETLLQYFSQLQQG